MNKILFNTIKIKVPSEMIELTKTGKIKIKKTLTKTSNISRSQKQPAIKLLESNDNKIHILSTGKEWNVDELKNRMVKSNALAKKNKGKDIFNPTIKKMVNLNKFESNVIKRARQLGAIKNWGAPITTPYQFNQAVGKYKTYLDLLKNSTNEQADKYKTRYANKTQNLLNQLDMYDPSSKYKTFFDEQEYQGPSGFSKRKASRRKF